MAVTSIEIDPNELKQAKKLAGTTSNRETVDLALRTLIAVRRQPAAVERIIARTFEADQIDAPTITPAASTEPSKSDPRGKSGLRGKRVARYTSTGRLTTGARHKKSAR
ncbi:MAG: type II toxin-antitoxin system VapB family antitoxin [Actinomycetota bacterium]